MAKTNETKPIKRSSPLEMIDKARRVCAAAGAAPNYADRLTKPEQESLAALFDKQGAPPADAVASFKEWAIERVTTKVAAKAEETKPTKQETPAT